VVGLSGLSSQELPELLRRRLEGLPQAVPLAPPWINEAIPLLVSIGRRLDEVVKRLEKVERELEEIKQLLIAKR
jgi:hypothetical protein